jgi:hypothetical protein
MNKQRKTLEIAEKLVDDLDANDIEEAVRQFPKCRVAGEDQDNATDHIVGEMLAKHPAKDIDDDELVSELEDLVREKLKKTPKK